MKVCKNCEEEIGTPDGQNLCKECKSPKKRKERKGMMKDAWEMMGLTRCVGAMGGVYYE